MLGSGIQPLPVAVITTQDIGRAKCNQSTSALSRLTRDFRYGPIAGPVTVSTEPSVPSVRSFNPPDRSIGVLLANPGAGATQCFRVWSRLLSLSETPPPRRPPLIAPPPP